jgi:hypothetical protein
LNPLTHGIVTPLPMVYWTSYSWYIETPTNDILTLYQWYLEPPSMVFWPPYQWYIEPPTHGMGWKNFTSRKAGKFSLKTGIFHKYPSQTWKAREM